MSNRINRWAIATAALLLALVQSQAAWAQDVATPYSDSTTPSATAAMPVAADSQVPANTGAMLTATYTPFWPEEPAVRPEYLKPAPQNQ